MFFLLNFRLVLPTQALFQAFRDVILIARLGLYRDNFTYACAK